MEAVKIGLAARNLSLLTGVSRVVGELARRLPDQGFEPLLAAHRLPASPLLGPGGRALGVEKIPMVPLSSRWRAASFDWGARRHLRRAGAGLIHGHGDLTRQDVLSVHNCDAAAARHVPDGRSLSSGVRYIRERQFALRGARIIVANSQMVRRDLAEHYRIDPSRIRCVYYGVDLERFHPSHRDERRAALLRSAGWPPETRVALSVLSGDPAKRHFGLLAAAVHRAAESGPFALCVVGPVAVDGDRAVQGLKGLGRFFHVPAPPRVEDYFAAADVFLLPAFYEEFGLTVLEALAAGCPVVLVRRVGAAEVLSRKGDGLVIDDVNDPEELAQAVRASAALDRAAARRTAEQLTWERHVREIVRVYRELL